MNPSTAIRTLGELKASGYQSRSVREEMRDNLILAYRQNIQVFTGIHGYESTVIPDLERAILSRHSILLLGLRGQAKTRLARLMVQLLDEYVPVVEGSEINDDPLHPISRYARDLVAELGDQTPVAWLHRRYRYVEKLATPDVSIADLIGDVDPIKAANQRLAFSDERVIHFGLIPRAHRCLFVINEIPDLQARIQVALFNILQEGDIQIRGFKFRLPLDLAFVFTANPEDYTNRGNIITPLKDRIQSQILTHYPLEIETARKITDQEADLAPSQKERIRVGEMIRNLLERVAFIARESELVDQQSGVSARLSISALENAVSAAERRMLINQEPDASVRINDLYSIFPNITGKVELVYEGEKEGPYWVAQQLLQAAIKETFLQYFPDPESESKKKNARDPYEIIRKWFSDGNEVNLGSLDRQADYLKKLQSVAGLKNLVQGRTEIPEAEIPDFLELALFGLSECSVLFKERTDDQTQFSDYLSDMLHDLTQEDDE